MPITDIDCPECGTPFHSDNLMFELNPKCALGCGRKIERERLDIHD